MDWPAARRGGRVTRALLCSLLATFIFLNHGALGQIKELHIGESRGDVVRKMGAPRYWCGHTMQTTSTWYCPGGVGHETYFRNVHGHRYQIVLTFAADEQRSRLHPVMRIEQIDLMSDRPLPVSVILGDLPEAPKVCEDSCTVSKDAKGLRELRLIHLQPDRKPGLSIDFTYTFNMRTEQRPVSSLIDEATDVTIWDRSALPGDIDKYEEITELGIWTP